MIPKKRLRVDLAGRSLVLALAWSNLCPGQTPTSAPAQTADPIKLSFLFMGCNRIQYEDWKPHENPSSANLPQLKQSLQDMGQLHPLPSYLFFTGDLVVNDWANDEKTHDDVTTLNDQLKAWTNLYKKHAPNGKFTLIPLPGNHEMLMKDHKKEVPNRKTDKCWLEWLRDSKFDTFAKSAANGPKPDPPNPDRLADDQSRMTYSFNIGDVHFIVINTDTLTTKKDAHGVRYPGWVPYHWIEQDVHKAQKAPGVSAIFLIGHKPIMLHPHHEEDAILNTKEHPLGDRLQALFRANHKVRAYLCAHEHLWHRSRLENAPHVWQVIAGNGGSLLNSKWNPTGGPFFGFSQINVYASGKVGLVSYERPVPTPYFKGPVQLAKAKPEVILYPTHQRAGYHRR